LAAAWRSVAVGDYGNVLRHAERALHNVQQWPYDLDRGDFGTYLALLQAVTWVGLDGPQEAEPRALAAREALGDDNPASALSALILGVNRSLLGDPRAEADLRQAVALAQAFEVPSTHVEAQSLLGLHLLATGDVSGGCDAIEQARRDYAFHDLREMRSASGILFLATVALVARRGSVADVEQALAEQARVRAQLEAVFPWYRPLSGGVLAEVSIRLGDRAGYREYLTWCEPLTTYGGLCEAWATMARREYAAASPLMGLTPAELRVWELLKSRMTLSEIADALYLSRETVKSHTGSIYRKLGVASRREAQELADTWT
jgi:LuxR family maltose regulon positive regulatory protein